MELGFRSVQPQISAGQRWLRIHVAPTHHPELTGRLAPGIFKGIGDARSGSTIPTIPTAAVKAGISAAIHGTVVHG